MRMNEGGFLCQFDLSVVGHREVSKGVSGGVTGDESDGNIITYWTELKINSNK